MTQKEEQRQLVDDYVAGKVPRRRFIRGLIKTGISAGAAATYAAVLSQQALAAPDANLLVEGKKDIMQGKRKIMDGKADIIAGQLAQGKRELLDGKALIAEGLAELSELYAGL